MIPQKEEEEWPEAGSLFDSSSGNSGSAISVLKGLSEHSNRPSVKQQEAAADIAASQAVLKVLQEQEREQLEIRRLEAEIHRKLDDQEATTRKRRLEQEAEEVRRRIQREGEEAKIKSILLLRYTTDTLQHEIVVDMQLQLQSQQLPTPTSPLSVDATPFVPQAVTT